jgi:hypothetical protein
MCGTIEKRTAAFVKKLSWSEILLGELQGKIFFFIRFSLKIKLFVSI